MLNCDVTFERQRVLLLSLTHQTNKTSWNRRYFAESNQDEPNHFSPFLNSKPTIPLKFICLTPYTPHYIFLQRGFAQQNQRTSKLIIYFRSCIYIYILVVPPSLKMVLFSYKQMWEGIQNKVHSNKYIGKWNTYTAYYEDSLDS